MNKLIHYAKLILPAALAVCFAAPVSAANCTSIASGSWDALATWGVTLGVPTGCPLAIGATGIPGVPGANDTVTILNGHAITTAARAAASTLTIDAGGLLSVGANRLRVGGATSISGTIDFTALPASSSTRFTGPVTVNAGGVWTNTSANIPITFRGGLINNGTFSAGTGLYTFSTNDQVIGGTSPTTFTNLDVSAVAITLGNNVTVTGALTGPTVTLIPTCPNDYTLTFGAQVWHSCMATVISINTASPNPTTSGAAVSWTVSFGTSVSGVTAANFALVQAGGVTGATITSVTGAGATWTVNASAGTGTGTLGLNMVNVAGISPALTTTMPFVGQVYTVSAPPPGTQPFDAVEVGGAIGSPIRTKIAGLAFNLDVLAVKNGAIDTGYTRTVIVDLIAGAAACTITTPPLAGVTVTPVGYKYTKGCGGCDNGRHTFSFTSLDAHLNVRVRVQDDKGKIGCSYDNFAIRPNSFTGVSVTDLDWQTAGIARALTNTGASGGNVHKAGQPFTVQATAVNAAVVPTTTTNYVGTPTALLTACAGTACTATFGTFSVGAAAVAGVINSNIATYSEAGSFALQLQDQTFANVDALDSTTTERYFSSAVINVGRFVPDHFALSAASIANRSDIPCPTCTFTYMGEQMNALFTLTAQAAGGSTTQNYTGVLARLDPTAAGNPLVFGAVDSTATPTYLTARLDTSLTATGGFVAGVANVTAPLAITHPTTGCPTAPNCPDGPYALLDIGIAPQDGDGVIMAAYDLDTDAIVGNDHTKVGRTEVRYGRIKVSNAYGSELLPLTLTATAQYYTATGWANSVTDSVTNLTLAANYNVVNNGTTTGTTAASKNPASGLSAGKLTITLAKPTGGATGTATINPTLPPSLVTALPVISGTATFGVYKGNNSYIYRRESY